MHTSIPDPRQDAWQEMELAELHAKRAILLPGIGMFCKQPNSGQDIPLAVIETVGAGLLLVMFTETPALIGPLALAQVMVNVWGAVIPDVVSVPLVFFAPDHPPEAVQEVTLADVHVKVTKVLFETEIGPSEPLAFMSTIGARVQDCDVAGLSAVTPQLFKSVTDLVCVPFEQTLHEPTCQLGVQSAVAH